MHWSRISSAAREVLCDTNPSAMYVPSVVCRSTTAPAGNGSIATILAQPTPPLRLPGSSRPSHHRIPTKRLGGDHGFAIQRTSVPTFNRPVTRFPLPLRLRHVVWDATLRDSHGCLSVQISSRPRSEERRQRGAIIDRVATTLAVRILRATPRPPGAP